MIPTFIFSSWLFGLLSLGVLGGGLLLARGMLGMLAYDATQTLPTIDVPTLLVPGDRDPVCRPEASKRMEQDVPRAQLAPLMPAKHMGLLEHNEHFAELVRTFALACV